MKRIFCCLGLLCITRQISEAQTAIHIQVKNADGTFFKEGKMILRSEVDSVILYQGQTDTVGAVSFKDVPSGNYLIQAVSPIGSSVFVPFKISGNPPDTTLPMITFTRRETGLKEVSITALRPTLAMKNGALIMDVARDPSAAGSTVIELLKRIPGVIVGAQNTISVDGKNGVQFLLDGRLQQLPVVQVVMLLSNMPAEAVGSIELMKNPSAKYDAAGTGGLINIVSRRNPKRGINGSVTESAGIGKRFGNGLNWALDFRSNKWTLFTNATYLERNPLAIATLDRSLTLPIGAAKLHSDIQSATVSHSLLLKAGLEYTLTENTTAGLSLSWAPVHSSDLLKNHTVLDAPNASYSHLKATTDSRDRYNNRTATIYVQHRPDTLGAQLNFSLDFTGFTFGENRLNENRFLDETDAELKSMRAYRNTNDLDFRILIPKLDFIKPLSKSLNLEAGAKASLVENHSSTTLMRNDNAGAFFRDSALSNSFRYQEHILAAYVNVLKSWTKISLQTGLRGEYTAADGEKANASTVVSRNYFNTFPNLSLNYKPGEKSSYQFTYSYRIDRPAYDQLVPYKVFNDQLNYSTGNPSLKPQYSHVATLDFSYNHFLFTSLSYTATQNSIYGYPVTAPGSQVQVDTVVNFATRHLLSGSVMLQQQPAKWYQIQLSGTAAYSRFKGTLNEVDASSAVVVGFIRMGNDFILPQKFRLQLNANYNTPYQDAIQQYAARGTLDLALQRRFLEDRITAVLAVNDLLYTDRTTVTTTLPDQSYRYAMRNDTRRLRLTLTYRFGGARIDRKVKMEPEEEAKRIKKAS